MDKNILMSLRKLRFALGLVFLALLCLGACVALEVIHCARLNIPPEAPVYPQSTLVEQISNGVGTSRWPILTYIYTSTDPAEKVVAFYEARGACCRKNEWGERITCHGEAAPFGEYFAYVDLNFHATESITSYTLEIWWRGCTGELE